MLQRIAIVAHKEWLSIIRSKQALLIIFVIPLLYTAFTGFIYWQGKVTHLPLAVYDQDNSALSRELISDVRSNESFGQVYFVDNFTTVKDLLLKGICKAALVIPEDFADKITKGNGAQVMVIADGSNMIYPNAAVSDAGEVVKTFSAQTGIKTMLQENILPDRGIAILSALSFRDRALYNPGFSYSYFLVFGVLIALWQITSVMGISVSIAKEKYDNTWVNFMLSPLGKAEIIAGKILPYYLINLLEITFVYVFGVEVLHLPMRGNPFLLLALTALFLLVVTGVGVFCSLLADTPLNAARYPMLVFLPSFIISGYTWPLEAMPAFIRNMAYCLPLTWMLQGFRAITMRGLGLSELKKQFIVLGLMAVLLYTISYGLLKKYENFSLKERVLLRFMPGLPAEDPGENVAEEVQLR